MIGLIIGLVCGGLLILLGLLLLFVDNTWRKVFNHRGDGSNSIRYNHPSDYPNLNIKHGYFETRKGYRLSYNIYKKDAVNIKATLVMIHGIGFSHYYLFPMIEKLCNDGYQVFAYDQFASGASEGRSIGAMTTSLKDLPFVFKFVESNPELNKYPLYVFGHSWGGFIAFSSLRYSKNIKKVISVAGFTNEGCFSPTVSLLIKLRNFFYYGFDAFYNNRKSVRKSNAKMMYLQGDHDLVVNPAFAGKKYEIDAKKNPNLSVVILPNKGHCPYNDDESQAAQDKVLGEFGLLGGVYVPDDHFVDFTKISKVDEKVYKIIVDFYNN